MCIRDRLFESRVGELASRNRAGEVSPHVPGRARRVGEARVRLQPLLRQRRDAAKGDVEVEGLEAKIPDARLNTTEIETLTLKRKAAFFPRPVSPFLSLGCEL